MRKNRMVRNYRVRWLVEKPEYMSERCNIYQWIEVC